MTPARTHLVEGFLAKACNDLTWVYRCTDGGLWGQAHAIAASCVQMSLCACLALKGKLPDSTAAIERAFREQFDAAAASIDLELARMADLRQRLDHTPYSPFDERDWARTRENLARILHAVGVLLPQASVGRMRLDAARQLLLLARPQYEESAHQVLLRLA